MAVNTVNGLLDFLATVDKTEEEPLIFSDQSDAKAPEPVFALPPRPRPTNSGKARGSAFSSDNSVRHHVRIPDRPSSASSSDELLGVGFRGFQSPKRKQRFTRNTYKSPHLTAIATNDMKYVVVTGGVVSGLGKGITASSIGLLLKNCGMRVTAIKIDPYLNIDAGTMSPYEHGEVYVLDDGGECDLDLGNYERFLDVTLTRDHNITTGKIYQNVLTMERQGEFLGKTVQVVPHITDEIQNWISRVAHRPVDGSGKTPQVCMIELGGTVGDIESSVYLEALRQFQFKVGRSNLCHIHVSLITVVGAVGEQKSKPTQHSVRTLRATGLIPNIIVCRSSEPILESIRQKVSLFSMVPESHVVSVHDVNNIYQVPRMLMEQNVVCSVLDALDMDPKREPLHMDLWDQLSNKAMSIHDRVTIGIVGKYTGLSDSYLSVTKALSVGALHCDRKLKIIWIDSEHLETVNENAQSLTSLEEHEIAWEKLRSVDGILIPGGFGDRGIEGKIKAVQYARESRTPFLGICLGMQCAVIEYARDVLDLRHANSTEFNPETPHPVVKLMLEHNPGNAKGGTMRLGSRTATLECGSLAHLLYGDTVVRERHRHRYEVNPDMLHEFEKHTLVFSAKDAVADPVRMEMIELPESEHPFFFATQFHPEFKSRPFRVSPPFLGLLLASARILDRDDLRAKVE